MDIHYSIPDYGEEETTKMELRGSCWDIYRPIEQEDILEECAKDHFYNHDGWGSSWPLVFALHDGENGTELCRRTIDMEAEPVFYARVS